MPRKKTIIKKPTGNQPEALPAAVSTVYAQRSDLPGHIQNALPQIHAQQQEYIQQLNVKNKEYSIIKEELYLNLMKDEPARALQHVMTVRAQLEKDLSSYQEWKECVQKSSGIRICIKGYEETLIDLWEQVYTLEAICIIRAKNNDFNKAQPVFDQCISERWEKSLACKFELFQERIKKTSKKEIKSLCLIVAIDHYIKEDNIIQVIHCLKNMEPEFRRKYSLKFSFTDILDCIFLLLYGGYYILSPNRRAYRETTLFSFNQLNYDEIIELQKKVKASLGDSDDGVQNILSKYSKEVMEATLRMDNKIHRFFNSGSHFHLMLKFDLKTAERFFPMLRTYFQEAKESLTAGDNELLGKIEGRMGGLCDQYILSLPNNSDKKEELEMLRNCHLKNAVHHGDIASGEALAQATNDRSLQRKLAEEGLPNSCFNEAIDLINELPSKEYRTKESYSKILSLLHTAADKNFFDAFLELGNLFMNHPEIADNAKTIECWERAAEYNQPNTWIWLAVALYQSNDPLKIERAFELLHMARNAGSEEEIVMATVVLADLGFIQAHSDLMYLELYYDNQKTLDQLKSIKSFLFGQEVFNTLEKIQTESSEKTLYQTLTSIQTSFTYYIEAISLSPDKIALLKSDFSPLSEKFVYFFQEMACVFSAICLYSGLDALFKDKEQIKRYIDIAYNHLLLLLQQYPQHQSDSAVLKIIYSNFVESSNKKIPFVKLTKQEMAAQNVAPKVITITNRVKPGYELSEASLTTVLRFCQSTNTENLYYLASVFYQLGTWAKRNFFESESFLLRNKEEIIVLVKRFRDGLQSSAKAEGLENALIGLGLLRIRANDSVLSEIVSRIIRRIDESTEALSIEQYILSIQGLSYFDMTKNQNVLSRLIDKVIEHPNFNSISFRQIAILSHSLAIIEANLIKKNECRQEIIKKLGLFLAHLLKPALTTLENRQPYFSLHQFILAMDYFKYSRGELMMPLMQNECYILKFCFIKNQVKYRQTVSTLQRKIHRELERVYGSVESERLFSILPGDCFLPKEHTLIEVNGKTHYYHTTFDLESIESPRENIGLERTHLDVFHCHYKVLAYWAETNKTLQVIIVPYTMENISGQALKEYIGTNSVTNSSDGIPDEQLRALKISASAAQSAGFLPMPRDISLAKGGCSINENATTVSRSQLQ